MKKTRLAAVSALAALTAILAGCGGSAVNTEIECSGTYELVSGDDQPLPELLDGWFIKLHQHDSGYYLVEWMESRDGEPISGADGNVFQDVAMGFGDDMLAIGSMDGPLVLALRVGDDVMAGHCAQYGSDQVWTVNALGAEPGELPKRPELGVLETDGVFDVKGDNPPPEEDTYYEGVFRLEAHGEVIANEQKITTAGIGQSIQDPFVGVGLLAEDHLVLMTGTFLAVYTGGDGSWDGMWTMAGNEDMAKEELDLQ